MLYEVASANALKADVSIVICLKAFCGCLIKLTTFTRHDMAVQMMNIILLGHVFTVIIQKVQTSASLTLKVKNVFGSLIPGKMIGTVILK